MFYKVFLDTNIYDGANYSFRSFAFEKMREYAAAGDLELVINSVIEGEVRSHIKRDVKKAVKALNEVVSQRAFAGFRKLDGFSSMLEKKDSNEWVNVCDGEFSQLLMDCKAVHISVNGIDVENIMVDYFAQKYPFEAQKPEEFKDAIAVSALLVDIYKTLNEMHQNKASNADELKYCVISNDKGFRQAVKNGLSDSEMDDVRLFESLNQFIDYTVYMNRQAQFLKAFILSEYGRDEMEETVRQAIQNAVISIGLEGLCYVDEQDIVDIDDIKFTPYILGIFEEDGVASVAKLALDASCTVKVGYKYTDEGNSFWDKEDNAYLWKTEVEMEGSYSVQLEIVFSLDISDCRVPDEWNEENEKDFEYDEYSVEFDDYIDVPSSIDLDEDNLIEEEVIEKTDPFEEEYEDDGNVVRNTAYDTCPDCGSPIGIENDGENGFCINCAHNH